VAERQNDPQGLALLARNEAAMGNFKDAYAAQSRLIAIKGDEATPSDFADLADMMILAAGGYISPEAEAALNAALERQPRNGVARYYMGLLQAQVGRFDLAFQTWRGLLEESTPNAPWIPAIRQGLPELAFRAGVNYELPALVAQTPALRGPDAAAIEAAEDMSAEDRQAFIRNMVEQLNDRLASEGGSAQEWAQLIGALSNLGESERAQAIYAEALNVFAEDAASLSLIRSAGASAGLSE
jgi:cytochrome c-type biogenesis protein CcmH